MFIWRNVTSNWSRKVCPGVTDQPPHHADDWRALKQFLAYREINSVPIINEFPNEK